MKDAEPGSTVACPTCNGPLSADAQAWTCEVGHRFSFGDLAGAQGEAVIRSLWYSLRALQDRAIASKLMAVDYDQEGSHSHATRLRSQGIEDLAIVEHIHELLRGFGSKETRNGFGGPASHRERAGSGSHSEP